LCEVRSGSNTRMHGADTTGTGGISYFEFIWTIFLLTSAGPFGFEYVVMGVGVGYSLMLIILFALLYSFPIALLSSELNSLMPANYGQIIWAYRAFHNVNPKLADFLGFLNAMNVVVFCMLRAAATPVVLLQYLTTITGSLANNIEKFFIVVAVVVSAAVLNCFQYSLIARINTILCILVLLPFFVTFVWQIPEIDPAEQWMPCPPMNWSLAITTCLWEMSGFEMLGNICNEIGFSSKRLYSAFLIGVAADVFALFLPIITSATLADNNCTAWFDGFFAVSYGKLSAVLQYSVAVGSVIINWCIYVAAVGIISRQIWALAQPFFAIDEDGRLVIAETEADVEDVNCLNTRIAINVLPHRWIGQVNRSGAPVAAVMVVSIVILLANIWLDFAELVEFNLFVYFVYFVIEMAAFMTLKYKEPSTHRSFEIPYGMTGACVVVGLLCLSFGTCFVLVLKTRPYMFLICCALNLLFVTYYFVAKKFCRRMHQDKIVQSRFRLFEDDSVYMREPAMAAEEIQPLI